MRLRELHVTCMFALFVWRMTKMTKMGRTALGYIWTSVTAIWELRCGGRCDLLISASRVNACLPFLSQSSDLHNFPDSFESSNSSTILLLVSSSSILWLPTQAPRARRDLQSHIMADNPSGGERAGGRRKNRDMGRKEFRYVN
jgi:hypothetical protein